MQLAVAEPPAEGVLKPGFTAIPNVLWDSGIMRQLKHSELMVFLVLYRFTAGYLRSWTCVGETLLLQMTGLSASTLYEAKKGLRAKGFLEVKHMVSGRCEYRICEGLQTLRPEAERAVVARFARKASAVSEAHPSGQPEPCKESKENLYHHQPQANFRSKNLTPTQANRSEGDDELSELKSQRSTLSKRLVQLGVSEFMAHKLVRERTPEMIAQAVDRLKVVQVENPAGYLVSEILRGGYGLAVVDKGKLQREEREKIHQLRVSQREEVQAQREQSSQRVAQKLDFFESLGPEQQQRLRVKVEMQARQEGFLRLPGWGPEHPAYRGLLSEVLEAELKQRE
ncbi:hypothetical protein ABS71_07245 [bacterium SCN 62-11]|nr:MAG: hypothetical protein ABS71_07245 [bacterium SCN 62-11]